MERYNLSGLSPLVSILIPTYNRPHFLQQALLSALNQTYNHTEIIICDNSEGDQTKNLIDSYVESNKNIKYVKNESDIGYVNNMRKCIEFSKGEYISFLMDDDLFDNRKLSRMVPFLISYPNINLVTSYKGYVDEKGDFVNQEWIRLSNNERVVSGQNLLLTSLANTINIIGEPTVPLFRRNALQDCFGSYLDKDYTFMVDNATWLSLFTRGDVAYIPDALSYCRLHEGQASKKLEVSSLGVEEWFHILIDSWKRGIITEAKVYKGGLVNLMNKAVMNIKMGLEQDNLTILKQNSIEQIIQVTTQEIFS